MKYISLFSGIEAASVAWEPLGWEPVAFSEIDPFACAVLNERFPSVPNLGDITRIDWSDRVGSIDLVAGGSPCQSFSVAGNREGLAGESGLMFEYIRAVRAISPRWFVWENVPGALSSEGGAAFGQLLSEMDACGYGMAWRVLDAQFFDLAQSASVCSLSAVLVTENVPPKYSLKAKTCAGIMDRARRKGRSLPPQLYAALASTVKSHIASKVI